MSPHELQDNHSVSACFPLCHCLEDLAVPIVWVQWQPGLHARSGDQPQTVDRVPNGGGARLLGVAPTPEDELFLVRKGKLEFVNLVEGWEAAKAFVASLMEGDGSQEHLG